MPVVSTDDPSRNQRYPWKGPASFPFGFEVRFNTVGLFAALTGLSWLGVAFLAPNLRLGFVMALGTAVLSALVARKVMRHIDADKPLAYYAEIVRTGFNTPRPPQPLKRKRTRR